MKSKVFLVFSCIRVLVYQKIDKKKRNNFENHDVQSNLYLISNSIHLSVFCLLFAKSRAVVVSFLAANSLQSSKFCPFKFVFFTNLEMFCILLLISVTFALNLVLVTKT